MAGGKIAVCTGTGKARVCSGTGKLLTGCVNLCSIEQTIGPYIDPTFSFFYLANYGVLKFSLTTMTGWSPPNCYSVVSSHLYDRIIVSTGTIDVIAKHITPSSLSLRASFYLLRSTGGLFGPLQLSDGSYSKAVDPYDSTPTTSTFTINSVSVSDCTRLIGFIDVNMDGSLKSTSVSDITWCSRLVANCDAYYPDCNNTVNAPFVADPTTLRPVSITTDPVAGSCLHYWKASCKIDGTDMTVEETSAFCIDSRLAPSFSSLSTWVGPTIDCNGNGRLTWYCATIDGICSSASLTCSDATPPSAPSFDALPNTIQVTLPGKTVHYCCTFPQPQPPGVPADGYITVSYPSVTVTLHKSTQAGDLSYSGYTPEYVVSLSNAQTAECPGSVYWSYQAAHDHLSVRIEGDVSTGLWTLTTSVSLQWGWWCQGPDPMPFVTITRCGSPVGLYSDSVTEVVVPA